MLMARLGCGRLAWRRCWRVRRRAARQTAVFGLDRKWRGRLQFLSALRKSGLRVIGYGRAHAPISFRRACNEFIDVGLLARPAQVVATPVAVDNPANEAPPPKPPKAAKEPKRPADPKPAKVPRAGRPSQGNVALSLPLDDADPSFFEEYGGRYDDDVEPVAPPSTPEVLLRKAIANLDLDENGCVELAELSEMVRRLDPEFNVRAYGCNQFIKLVRQQAGLVVRTQVKGKQTRHFVRVRDAEGAEDDIPF
ncbi:MAG: hypothetical protein EXR77_20280 [Myxococcales bacterium]|nr:hypothetical protein [Myxococcales bacterium]